MRAAQRPRRPIGKTKLALMTPLLRYSQSRDAYILRLIGKYAGPVYRPDG